MSASPETFRNNIRTKLTSKIGEKYNKIATNIEKAIFNYAIKEATQKTIVIAFTKVVKIFDHCS